MREVNTTNMDNRFGEMSDVIIDETMLEEATEVEGLGLLVNIEEALTKNGTPLLRLYIRCKRGGRVQCNIMGYNKESTTQEDLYSFINSIVYIRGEVNLFNNMYIINLLSSPIRYENGNLRVQDFFKKDEEIDEQYLELVKEMNKVEEVTSLESYIKNLRNLKLDYKIKNTLLDNEMSNIGDGLRLVNTVNKIVESVCSFKTKEEIMELKYINILYNSLYYYINDPVKKEKPILDNKDITGLLLFNKYISNHELADNRLKEETIHLYSVLELGKEPYTLSGQLLSRLIKDVKESIFYARLDSTVNRGNTKIANGKRITKLK